MHLTCSLLPVFSLLIILTQNQRISRIKNIYLAPLSSRTAHMTTCFRQMTLAALLLFFAPFLLVYGQSQAREVEAHLTAGHAQAASEQEPEVRAELVLLLSGAEHSPTGKIIFHKMMLNAAAATTGEFEIINQRGKRLFVGRWLATAF